MNKLIHLPKKTLTEFEPVTLVIAASASGSLRAAVLDANVSGNDVPNATNVMAVISSLMPTVHPNKAAKSPMKAVVIPVKINDTLRMQLDAMHWDGVGWGRMTSST